MGKRQDRWQNKAWEEREKGDKFFVSEEPMGKRIGRFVVMMGLVLISMR